MSDPPEAGRAVARGLRFLERNQRPDGSFMSHSSASRRPFRRARELHTVFVPALMLSSLAGLEQPAARRIRDGLSRFLLQQKDDHWAFNYWASGAPEHRSLPYPNDLDDTFCALAALHAHDPSLIDEAALARIVKLLLAAEQSVGGPYRTWLVPSDSDPAWLDVDLAVNANVAYFLSLAGNKLPSLEKLMRDAIEDGQLVSPYYPSPYPVLYYLARAYDGPHRGLLLREARRLHAAAGDDLERALCLTARLRLGETRSLSAEVSGLLAGQRHDGSWPAAAFCNDPARNGKPFYNGAPALTTAFALEALELYARPRRGPAAPARTVPAADKTYDLVRSEMLVRVRRDSRDLPPDLRRTVRRMLAELSAGPNGPEITGLPAAFNRSLKKPLPPGTVSLEYLALANLYGWAAYTIYDDFLDDEGRPGLLPAANAAMRQAFGGFLAARSGDAEYAAVVREVFDAIDGANTWELAHCRARLRRGKLIVGSLPDYGDLSKLAERSLGHVLAPLAILSAAGATPGAVGHTRRALMEYLIVRQLNDDLHDWQEDLAAGHLTYVAGRVLAGTRVKPGAYEPATLIARTSRHFWHKTLPTVCRGMQQRIQAGRQELDRAGIFKETNDIGRLFDKLETVVDESLGRQEQAERFIKHYSDSAKP